MGLSPIRSEPLSGVATHMSQSANVRSVDAIREFRIAMTTFAEEARTALGSAEMEVRRTRDWLSRDQLTFWQAQVKRRNELLSIARTELHRRRLSQQGSDAVSDSEQKENVRTAQRRLEEAEVPSGGCLIELEVVAVRVRPLADACEDALSRRCHVQDFWFDAIRGEELASVITHGS